MKKGFGGICTVQVQGIRRDREQWKGRLYRPVSGCYFEPVKLRAVPYYAWANRGAGKMNVWMNHIPIWSTGRMREQIRIRRTKGK